jgi:hypothetical protein
MALERVLKFVVQVGEVVPPPKTVSEDVGVERKTPIPSSDGVPKT